MRYKYALALKWFLYSFFLLVAVVFQTTPVSSSLEWIRPIYLFPLVISVAMLEGEFAGAIFGCVAGFVWDVAAGKLPGFSAFLLLLICFGCALLVAIYLRVSYRSHLLLTAWSVLFFALVEYFFFYALFGYENSYLLLWFRYLPQFASTLLLTPLIFFAARKIHRIGSEIDE